MSDKATPRPWSTGGIFAPRGPRPETGIWGPTPPGKQSGTWIAKGVGLDDAALIVRAVNCHDEMLAALKGVLRVADRATPEFYAARAAIARAEGGGE